MSDGERGEHSHEEMRGLPGPRGATGRTGLSAPYLSRNRTLALAAFVLFAFLLLAVRSEINANHIRQGVYEACLQRADIDEVRSDCERFR